MRILTINNNRVDIDDQTALGMSFASWDITDPAAKRVSSTNTFTVPATDNNLNIIGYPASAGQFSKKVYEELRASYWTNGQQLMKNYVCRVTEISDRISILAYNKPALFTEAADVTLEVFFEGFMDWLYTWYGIPNINHKYAASTNLAAFLTMYTDCTDDEVGICLPYFFGNLKQQKSEVTGYPIEGANTIKLRHYDTVETEVYDSLHFCVFSKTLFKYIEYYFGVDMLVDSATTVYGNVWNDQMLYDSFIPMPPLNITRYMDSGVHSGYYFTWDWERNFAPYGEISFKDKTVFDLLKLWMQTYNLIVDEYETGNGTWALKFSKFDDITEDYVKVVDWSGKMDATKSKIFKPVIDGYCRSNFITYGSVYEGAVETAGAKKLTCNNANLDNSTVLFSLDSHYPSNKNYGTYIVEELMSEPCLSNLMFMIKRQSGTTEMPVTCYVYMSEDSSGNLTAAINDMDIAQMYTVANEYDAYNDMLEYVKYYELYLWLDNKDVAEIKYHQLYYIKELAASFFLVGVEGFNPDKAMQATKVKLLKVGSRSPDYIKYNP